MFGTKSLLLPLSLALLQAFSTTAQAGPWKSQWGSLFSAAAGSDGVDPREGNLESTVFEPLKKALSTKRTQVLFDLVDSLPQDRDAWIEPDFSNDRLNFRIQVTRRLTEKPALMAVRLLPLLSLASGHQGTMNVLIDYKRPAARQNMTAIFSAEGSGAVSQFSFLELLYDLEAGSPAAKERWMQRQALWLDSLEFPEFSTKALAAIAGVSEGDMKEEISRLQAEELAKTNEELPRLQKEAKSFRLRQEKIWNDWKKETQAFEKLEAMELKLNDLIVRNDRQGVRRLIETYLPWPLMEPVEVKTWKNWLDAIEFPRTDKTTVAFRGVDYQTDFIQKLETPEGTKIGFMSTLLTKNQGSYTRRLRSLATKRSQNGDDDSPALKKTGAHYKIADQMSLHSIDPVGSVFLSFTPSPAVAHGFIGETKFLPADSLNAKPVPGGGLLAVRMDSRRLIPNLPSRHLAEYEYLTPLVVFPDEIVKYEEFADYKADNQLERFVEDVSRKTGQKFSMEFGLLPHETTTSYYEEGLEIWEDLRRSGRGAGVCSKVFN